MKYSPFKELYGRAPPPLLPYKKCATMVAEVDILLDNRDAILDDLRMHLLHTQQQMQRQANMKRHDEEFQLGDQVYVKLCPYRKQSLAKRLNEKLSPRYYSPYTILQHIGKVAYKL